MLLVHMNLNKHVKNNMQWENLQIISRLKVLKTGFLFCKGKNLIKEIQLKKGTRVSLT